MPEFPIDTSFDMRSDARGRDPDQHSPTLRRYHRMLWSKPLSDGSRLDLSDTTPGEYLVHESQRGRFWLGSDSIIHTLDGFAQMREIIGRIPPQDIQEFHRIGYTIGGMLVFPSNRIDGLPTINGARACIQGSVTASI